MIVDYGLVLYLLGRQVVLVNSTALRWSQEVVSWDIRSGGQDKALKRGEYFVDTADHSQQNLTEMLCIWYCLDFQVLSGALTHRTDRGDGKC